MKLNLLSLRSKRLRAVWEERKDRAKNGASKRAGRGWGRKVREDPLSLCLSFHFSSGQNRKFRSSVFLCSETKRKSFLRWLKCSPCLFHPYPSNKRIVLEKNKQTNNRQINNTQPNRQHLLFYFMRIQYRMPVFFQLD